MDIDKDMDSSEEWYHIMIDNMIVSTKPQNLVAKMEKTQKNGYVPVMCSIFSSGVWVSWFWDLGITNSEICVTSF